MTGVRFPFVLSHITLWLGLAAAAFATAGAYTFASCWPIIPTYMPPVAILMIFILIGSPIILILSLFRPALRSSKLFSVGLHDLIFSFGWIGCFASANAKVSNVSCL